MGQTTLDLIKNIKLRGSMPSANDLFSDSDYLRILNDEMVVTIVPLLNKVNEEYFLSYEDKSISSGVSHYRIPKRAIGSSLRDVQLIEANGNVISLPRLFEEDKTTLNNNQTGYFLKGNQVVLSPTPTSDTQILRLAYFRRPSQFVLPASTCQIASIDTNLNQVIVGSVPSTFTTNILVDFVQGSSPYDILDMDQVIVGVSGTTLTFSTIPQDLAVGDYISLASEACVPMIPEELVPTLVQSALCVCLSSKKDKSVEFEMQRLEQMKSSLLKMLSPRTKSNDIKIRNPISLLNYHRR